MVPVTSGGPVRRGGSKSSGVHVSKVAVQVADGCGGLWRCLEWVPGKFGMVQEILLWWFPEVQVR